MSRHDVFDTKKKPTNRVRAKFGVASFAFDVLTSKLQSASAVTLLSDGTEFVIANWQVHLVHLFFIR